MFCHSCGEELKSNAVFCSNCGEKQEPSTESSSVPYVTDPVQPERPHSPNTYSQFQPAVQSTAGSNASNGKNKKKKRHPVRTAIALILVISILGSGYWMFLANDGRNNPFHKASPQIAALEEALSHLSDEDDDDGDGLNNYFEEQFKTDRNNPDTDGDGLSDYIEIAILKTDPLKTDTDGNGVDDGDEDTDDDGLTNLFEIEHATSPVLADTDFDGISDNKEMKKYKTDPNNRDTDGDGASDGWEITHKFDPLKINKSFSVTEREKADDGKSTASAKIKLSPEQAETLHINEITAHFFLNEDMPGYIAPAYDFSVYGDFKSAEISFKLDKSLLKSKAKPTIYWVNPDTQMLEEQPTTVKGTTVKATVTHFSQYIVADKRYVDTDKKFGSSDVSQYEDYDFDGYLNNEDPDPFVWDISDRDLAMCAGICYDDIPYCNDISLLSKERQKNLNSHFDGLQNLPMNDKNRVSADELKGWEILKVDENYNTDTGFSSTVFQKGNNIIVAFRGSEGELNPFTQHDWMNDFTSYLIGVSFQDEDAKNLLKNVLEKHKGNTVYVTGHSLGGHLAYTSVVGYDFPFAKVATFNAFGLSSLHDNLCISILKNRSVPINAFRVKNDMVSSLPITEHPGKTIMCSQEYFNGKLPEHSLYNFFDDLTPTSRNIKLAQKPNSSAPADNSQTGQQLPDNSQASSAKSPENPTGSIKITGLTPNTATAGQPESFSVTVDYSFSDALSCEINAGATTDSDPNTAVIYDQKTVTNASGTETLTFNCTPVKRADNIFVIYVEIALPGASAPLDSDAYSIPLSGSSYSGNFAIEGKWKQVGEDTHGQMQKGSIIVFGGVNCNVWSPQDTYAFYKEGDEYRLDISGLLFNTTMSYQVTVIDNDNIEIRPGSGSEYGTGAFAVKLKRVQ